MSAGFFRTIHTSSPDQTAKLARQIAPLLVAGDVILLCGEIGAGKTHFARALIDARLRATGRGEDIPSPTFTIVQTYHDGSDEIWHVDLYRLYDPDEIPELGLDEAIQTGICLIEWPDRLGPFRPDDALEISFSASEKPEARTLALQTSAERWAKLIPVLDDAADDRTSSGAIHV